MGDSTPLKVMVVSYPYPATHHSGRGHSRWGAALLDELTDMDEVDVSVLDEGELTSVPAVIRRVPSVANKAIRARADVYHALSPIGGATMALLGRRPLVVTIHDMLPFQGTEVFAGRWKTRLAKLSTMLSVTRSDAIITGFEATARDIVTRFPAARDRVHVVNPGIDHSRFRPDASARPPGPSKVIFIGEVCRGKGVDTLLEAFARIQSGHEGTELVIAGKPTDEEPALLALGESLGIRHLAFRGFIPEDELADYYRSGDLLAFPSSYGYSLGNLEAMACGVPVIAGASGDTADAMDGSVCLVPPGDVGQLAEAMDRLLSDREQRAALAAAGINRARQFSWDRTADEVVALYHRVRRSKAGGRSRGR